MRRTLIVSRTFGVPVASPEDLSTDITAALDALNTGGSLVGHWPMTTTAARIGPAPITVVGTHETGLPQIAAGGGNSRGFNGLDAYATIDLTNNADFLGAAGTVIAFVQPDRVDVKQSIVNLNSLSTAGSFSLEIEAGGVPRVFKRNPSGTVLQIRGSAGVVVDGRPWLMATTWGTDGLRLYVMDNNRAPGEITPHVAQATWTSAVPATQAIFVGRWQGSAVSFFDGVMGHLAWFNRQLSLAELETLAPLLRQVVYLPSFNAGSIQEGTTVTVSMEDRGHPINGFTTLVTSPPSLSGSTAVPTTPPGMTVDYTAGLITVPSQADNFGITITANGQVSAPATVSITVTDTQAAQPPQVFNHPYSVFGGSTTELNVLDNATNKPANPNLDLTSSLSGLSVINDNSPTARLRYVAPSVTEPVTHVRGFKITGPPDSNTANVTITVNPPGDFTPFPFVTVHNPTLRHTGATAKHDVRARPLYNADDPRSASKIDPMSGLEFFRVSGTFGTTVRVNGANTGLLWPHNLVNENNPRIQRCWNADSNLLLIDRYFSRDDDPSNNVGSYLIDADGSHGASVPWRIIRASGEEGLGDSGINNVSVWDWRDPSIGGDPDRMFALKGSGVSEWFPATGVQRHLFGYPSGYSEFWNPRRGRLHTSHDGVWMVMGARRNSDRVWGGFRVNLSTGTFGPFRANPHPVNDDNDRASGHTSPLAGRYTSFAPDDHGDFGDYSYMDMTTGQVLFYTSNLGQLVQSHSDQCVVDGVEYVAGSANSQNPFRLMTEATGVYTQKANFPGGNPQHTSCRNFKDTFERHGATGGSTSGLRYAMWCRSNEPRGIMGIRLGANDHNVVRYILNHRSIRTSNSDECHPNVSPDFEYIVFNSDWTEPGVNTNQDVLNYVILIPDAWKSPNNNGLRIEE